MKRIAAGKICTQSRDSRCQDFAFAYKKVAKGIKWIAAGKICTLSHNSTFAYRIIPKGTNGRNFHFLYQETTKRANGVLQAHDEEKWVDSALQKGRSELFNVILTNLYSIPNIKGLFYVWFGRKPMDWGTQ